STDEEPDSMEHREGDLAWYHPEELPDQSYAFRHDAFIENILEDEPFTALVDDIEDNGTFDEEATILHSTTGLMDWPDEDYLEQDLITAPETVKEHYFQEK
ncbi:MAG: hypothetical protein MUP66_03800, partial [Candidatus Nanohaloarchaeota archaeon QJJ-5]|nr:hypothetical protein [Candidatus Nanohaloarchaeota archaeon QJJ-5]